MSYNPYQRPEYPPQYQPPAPPAASEDEEDDTRWWQYFLYGIGSFGIGTWLYIYLSQKEQEGGRVRMWWVFALLYDFLGKWGITGVLAGAGTIFILVGAWQLSRKVRGRA